MTAANDYSQMQKNTVSSENQVKIGETIYAENIDGKGIRVLFAGNSITLHDIRPSLGWHLHCGMAASSPDNDYVHILKRRILDKDSDAAFCVCQASGWEVNYTTDESIYDKYEAACDFNADIIVLRLIENCSLSVYDPDKFYDSYKKLISYFNKSGKAKVILTTGFWKHPGDELILKIGKELGLGAIYLGVLGEDDEMKAIGLFEHSGVAAHPGDKGMEAIADRIWETIKESL